MKKKSRVYLLIIILACVGVLFNSYAIIKIYCYGWGLKNYETIHFFTLTLPIRIQCVNPTTKVASEDDSKLSLRAVNVCNHR